MDGSSSVSSDSYLNATSDKFPLPSAWPRGYNYRLSFLWLSKNVDFQSRITSHDEAVRRLWKQILSSNWNWLR